MKMPNLSPLFLIGTFTGLCAPGLAQQALQAKAGPETTAPVLFVERPDEMEFRGVMVARPIQVSELEDIAVSPSAHSLRHAQALEQLGEYEVLNYVSATDEYLFKVPEGEDENSVAHALLAGGNFEYVEPDWQVYPVGCPNDTDFASQWHHSSNFMDSCAGWDLHTGDPSTVVAVLDTGIRTTHVEFQQNRREGFDAFAGLWENQGGLIEDAQGHGTVTTGCVAANGDNGFGVSGVGWNLGFRPVRVNFGDGTAGGGSSVSILTFAARTAIDAGDKVASLSYFGVTAASAQTTGEYIRSKGALIVWAAGNGNDLLTGDRDDSIIVVGASGLADELPYFSAYGPWVDLFAPGVEVYSTNIAGDDAYGVLDGTSLSCPLAAGLCGLIYSYRPSLSPEEVEAALRVGCDDIGAPGVDDVFGYGRINVRKSLESVAAPLDISFPNGRPQSLSPAGGETLRIRVKDVLDTLVPGSVAFYLDRGVGFESVPVATLASDSFEVTFPAGPCDVEFKYYVTAMATGAGQVTSPGNAPTEFHSARTTFPTVRLFEDFESPSGWVGGIASDTATAGIWTLVDPNGTIAQPEDDHTPAGTQCWVTGQGAVGANHNVSDVDGGATNLFSPIYDLTSFEEPQISYWRWFNNDTGNWPEADRLIVRISNDAGANWETVEVAGPSGPGATGGWIRHSFKVSDFVVPTAQVQLRFRASDQSGDSTVEAAIDDLEITEFTCANCWGYEYCTSMPNSSGAIGRLSMSGSLAVADNTFTLHASDLPANQNGLFFYGIGQAQAPFGNGVRCVGGALYRLPVLATSAGGTVDYSPDFTTPPIGGDVLPGSTWNYQLWFRDGAAGGAGFNTSEAISVTFCP